jgi:PKD repeat protein
MFQARGLRLSTRVLVPRNWVTAAFTAALLVSAGTRAGAAENRTTEDWAQAFEKAKQESPGFAVESVEEFRKLTDHYGSLQADGVTVRSFELPNGDQIHCVEVSSQRSLAASGHPLQLAPEALPAGEAVTVPRKGESTMGRPGVEFGLDGTKDAAGNERACPAQTFPRLMPRLENLYRYRKLDEIFQKTPGAGDASAGSPSSFAGPTQNALTASPHEWAHAYEWVNNSGMSAVFNVWSPTVEQTDEFSLSQLWVTRGQTTDNSLQTAETGWQVCRLEYGDSNPHLFIYSTTGNYQTGTGCYNLDCPRFVQTDNTVVIGGVLSPYSTQGGTQYSISLAYFRDLSPPHNWWLKFNGTWVGYFPNSLYNSQGIANYSDKIDFGGEIVNDLIGGLHTTTQMGSGHFPSEGFGVAAFTEQIRYFDTLGNQYDSTGLTKLVTNATYYDLSLGSSSDPNVGIYFYFGGPGRVPVAAPTANFSVGVANPRVGQPVQFTDTSTGTPTSWSWSFGDGGSSTAQNPIHTFTAPGTFTVTLTASNASGSNAKSQSVTALAAGAAPTANFSFSPSSPAPGQTVVFLDSSTGSPTSWSWVFGDGATASLQNVSHTYTLGGPYSVTLTVSNSNGSNAVTKTIQVASAPAQGFVYVLPSSAHSAGANGAFYTTDLSISNRGTATANMTIQFVGHDQDGTGGLQQARSLLPGSSITYADVLGSLFGVTSGYGGLLIKSDSAFLKLVGQTSTPPPSGGGTFGQSVPGLTSASFVTPSVSQALIALRQDASFRTNAVVMNVSQATAHVRLLLAGPDTTLLGSSEFDLAPLAMRQISGVVTALGAPVGTTDAVLMVSTTTSNAQIACYATVIDNVTNDPRTILP